MPFLTPLLGPLIGAVGSIGASAIAGNQNKTGLFGGSPQGVPNYTSSTLGKLPGMLDSGAAQTAQGSGNLADSANFLKSILQGSQEKTQQVLAPQVSTIVDQYDSAAKAGAELGPRGGGRTNALEAAKTGKVGAYGKLLGSALPGAASGLADVGKSQASIGLGQEQAALSPFNTSLNTQYQAGQKASALAGGLGGAFGGLLGNKLSTLIGGNKSTNSPTEIMD